MTDLERLWDDLPVGKAPTHDILREARIAAGAQAAARRRRLVLRPLLTAGVATGLIGAFVLGTTVGGGSGGPAGPGGSGDGGEAGQAPSYAAFQADLEPAESCEDLLGAYVDRALARVTAWGWAARYPLYDDVILRDGAVDAETPLSNRVAKYSADAHTVRQQNSDTGTNVQEIGVDEPDVVKTDGSLLVRLRDDELQVHDVAGGEVDRLATLDLPGLEGGEIMLAGDTVVAVGVDEEAPRERTPYGRAERRATRVVTVDLTRPEAPEVVAEATYDARLLSARQHGSTVRLVLSSGLPDLGFVHPGRKFNRRAALAHNRDLVERSTIDDWLPTITTDGASERLLDCRGVAVPSDELALDTVAVVGFDASAPGEVDAIGVAGATDIAYESVDHLYLAASPAWGGCCFADRPSVTGGTTHLFDFALDGTRATHVASGEVEGAVADRWAMDEADDVLRVAVGPTSETGPFNSVVTLRRDGQDLVEVGRLDGLGRNEDITSVRWSDGLAIVVTFRRVDPLYAVDLTDVDRPRLLGKLKIPGFSSYLHPLGPRRLVGVGEGPTGRGWGAQAGLFDVSDLRAVRRIDVHHYAPGTQPLAARDPRSFTFVHDARTILTVVEHHRGSRVGYLSVLRIDGGRLHDQRMQRVEYGSDVEQVRAVPLPDGRIVLVTGEDVELLELPAHVE
ncbi:beta-propeller domain-containing protein [Nocardioides sp. TF02-7]|uniref:beta-propeller domain-containing protein n=1 Tax=Nocardioides sp. TF02-7 TaxID=2917724 RepID=UPI001F0521D0|nr:beta-propeller domain-containing protein [Nocardioides sp. TF02-7]UMG94708.1 beta-propeller domain-containing protein [Nocardioides sp. TF02-7]